MRGFLPMGLLAAVAASGCASPASRFLAPSPWRGQHVAYPPEFKNEAR